MEGMIKEFQLPILVYGICAALVLLSICGDLFSGVRKARKAGIQRSSVGFRRTVDKICKYFNSLFSVGVIDSFIMLSIYIFQTKGMLSYFPLFPPFTIAMGAYLSFIEFRSVFENLEDKEKAKAKEDMFNLLKLLDNDRMNKIINILKEAKPKDGSIDN